MTFDRPPTGAVAAQIGPGAASALIGNVLRFCGGIDPQLNASHSAWCFVGKSTSPEHFCELSAAAVEWCRQLPAGGVATCEECGTPVFVPPATCVGYAQEADDGADVVIDRR